VGIEIEYFLGGCDLLYQRLSWLEISLLSIMAEGISQGWSVMLTIVCKKGRTHVSSA